MMFLCLLMAVAICAEVESLKNLPVPTGDYQVGVRKEDLIDPARREIAYPAGRLIPIQIYFPMQKGEHQLHPKIIEERAAGHWEKLQVDVYSREASLSSLNREERHPLILLNPGTTVAMTDYAALAEDLASHGYVVVAIQHELHTDAEEPSFWEERSVSRHARVIDNILCVFEWLKENQAQFGGTLDLQKVGLIGHSMGGNALVLLAQRAARGFKPLKLETLLPRAAGSEVKEVLILLDSHFPCPTHQQYPLLLLLAEERKEYQMGAGGYQEAVQQGHRVKYYPGTKHVSFMDHGYVDSRYFNGSTAERQAFFDQLRRDVRDFLKEQGVR